MEDLLWAAHSLSISASREHREGGGEGLLLASLFELVESRLGAGLGAEISRTRQRAGARPSRPHRTDLGGLLTAAEEEGGRGDSLRGNERASRLGGRDLPAEAVAASIGERESEPAAGWWRWQRDRSGIRLLPLSLSLLLLLSPPGLVGLLVLVVQLR